LRNSPRWLSFFRLQQLKSQAKIGKCESLLSIGSSFPFAQNIIPKSWQNPQPQKLPPVRQQRIRLPEP
jgi:hypothetical protein